MASDAVRQSPRVWRVGEKKEVTASYRCLRVFKACLNRCGAEHMFKTKPSMKTLLNTEKKEVTTSVLC